MWRDLFSTIGDLLYPPCCVDCGAGLFFSRRAFLCAPCEAQIKWISSGACRFCGEPSGKYAQLGFGCQRCRPEKLAFTRAVAATDYQQTSISALVKSFKYFGNRRLSRSLAQAMLPIIKREYTGIKIDFITAVPLYADRQALRGYNQSALLARDLSRDLALPYRDNILQRIRNTPAQAQLSGAQRKTNLQDAFIANENLANANVLLIDDVLTTGTTASECARALRNAKVKRIYVAVFAR